MNRRLSHFHSIFILLAALVALAPPALANGTIHDESASLLDPANGKLGGKALPDFDARWTEMIQSGDQWTRHSAVHEVLTREQLDGRPVVRRVQVADYGVWGVTNTTWLDADSLRSVRFERRVRDDVSAAVIEKLQQAGLLRSFRLDLDGTNYELTREPFEGEVTRQQGDLDREMVEGSALGLVLASLPLAQGTRLRIPVLFASPNDGSLQPYWVLAEVAAEGPFPVTGGAAVPCWRVDVTWGDYESGAVQSPGGPDQSGGSYWIAKHPKSSVPPVASYTSNSVRYELLP